MRIAVFTDAHANLPATRAVIDAVTAEGVDLIYHLGDAVAIGPQPAETLELLLSTPRMRLIMGNHDHRFVHGMPDPLPESVTPGEVAHQRWTHEQLDPSTRAVVARWPDVMRDTFHGTRVTFLHYGLRYAGSGFVPGIRNATEADMDDMFADEDAALVFYGHFHSASELTGRARYLNPGSLGCSRVAEARYYLAEFGPDGYALEYRRLPYDDADLFEAFESRRVPEREFIYQRFMGRRYPPA